jgi:predicted DNA-binding antitoxin AbrB/MazE fold protein
MQEILYAIYDGKVLNLDEPLDIPPNTRVKITIDTDEDKSSSSFIDKALKIKIKGPIDWSENIDHYLYQK